MPTYQYRCSLCGHEFEEFQSMKEDPLKECPVCHKEGLQRLIGGGAGMIFKGSGFYLTDYKGNTSKKTEMKSETKPEVKQKSDSTGNTAKSE